MSASRSPRVQRARAIARVIGAIAGFLLGLFYGSFVLTGNPSIAHQDTQVTQATLIGLACAGAAFMAVAAPMLSVDPYLWLVRFLDEAPALEVLGATAGALVGLVFAATVAVLLSGLPYGIGYMISISLALVLVSVGVRAGRRRREALADLMLPGNEHRTLPQPIVVIDTSVLIDGRIVDIARSGFLFGEIVIPNFVLEELQRLADSGDQARREKGKRGLRFVDDLKHVPLLTMTVTDHSLATLADVDAGLVRLAHELNGRLMTNDFNLNRLASAQDIPVLNINDLANAIKPIAHAGDSLEVRITKRGKEPHQGIGYLADGTMVVVEHGDHLMEKTATVTVSSVLQTSSGRMIFASAGDAERRTAS